MICGSLGFEDRRENEHNAFMEGLKEAYYRDYTNIVLETDHVDAYWRGEDKNFHSEAYLTDFEDNVLAVYLAEYGAQNFKDMVVMKEPFGRVQELWNLDMGLGPSGLRFQARRLEDVVHNATVEDIVNPEKGDVGLEEGIGEAVQIPMAEDPIAFGLQGLAAAAGEANQNGE
ncbi:hypothetical protein POM88_001187 [Heracleum sosnowskyi]|uniref:Uncharacterized protein n=1 Tax=Heracleum sosnowskyi TaxID=360622 RepID=A0AAD8NA41_9APIA|nr:hypothetical protein POM88_001187 [Heracleum sosnowskyi]